MNYQTFLVICGILLAIPFVIACIKGDPLFGLIVGFVTVLIMVFAASHGASMLGVHLIGFILGGFSVAKSLHDS